MGLVIAICGGLLIRRIFYKPEDRELRHYVAVTIIVTLLYFALIGLGVYDG